MKSESLGSCLEFKNVSKQYSTRAGDEIVALDPLDIKLEPGEFVAVVGPSGCGKSTLLQIGAGIIPPTAGQVRSGSTTVEGPGLERAVVFQNYALFPWRNVLDNVAFGLEQQRVKKKERDRIAREYLELVGLSQFERKMPNELSGGMKQRVALARAFAVKPPIILMDEPFGALDALTRRFLQRELLRIWEEHKTTVFFITHSVMEALYLADRIIVMSARPGRVKREIRLEMKRPRETTSAEFNALESDIFEYLDEEVLKTIRSGRAA